MNYSGIYIHIPFCRNRCNYCDFYITTRTDLADRYLKNLLTEIELTKDIYTDYIFDSVYIGGGTPSLLSSQHISSLLTKINECFKIQKNSEITLEVNPEDLLQQEDKIQEYAESGINRISFGLQSFCESDLIFLTRYSDTKKIEYILEKVLNHFKNTSVDIIYSIPGSGYGTLERTIEKIIELEIPHISGYTLIFEKNTSLYNLSEKKVINKNSDILESELYEKLTKKLTDSGYNHYEISNYAKSGYESVHNLKYWQYDNYLGLGASSHSFFYPKRWKNFSNIIKYNLSLENKILPAEKTKELSGEETEKELIFLGLRSRGINLKKFSGITGYKFEEKYSKEIEILCSNNFALINPDYFRLTENGFRIADEIAAKYF